MASLDGNESSRCAKHPTFGVVASLGELVRRVRTRSPRFARAGPESPDLRHRGGRDISRRPQDRARRIGPAGSGAAGSGPQDQGRRIRPAGSGPQDQARGITRLGPQDRPPGSVAMPPPGQTCVASRTDPVRPRFGPLIEPFRRSVCRSSSPTRDVARQRRDDTTPERSGAPVPTPHNRADTADADPSDARSGAVTLLVLLARAAPAGVVAPDLLGLVDAALLDRLKRCQPCSSAPS